MSVCLSVTSRCSVEVGEWIELSCTTERNLSWFRCVCRPVSAAIASDLVSKFERRRVPCCSLRRADRGKCCQLSSAVTRLLCPAALMGHFGIARSVHLSVPWRSCLRYRHAGCLQLSRVRTADPSADGRRSAASRTAICRGVYRLGATGAIPCHTERQRTLVITRRRSVARSLGDR